MGTEKRVEKISQQSMKLHTTPEGTSKRGPGISCLGRVGLRKRLCLGGVGRCRSIAWVYVGCARSVSTGQEKVQ